jgi:hypothetical protein
MLSTNNTFEISKKFFLTEFNRNDSLTALGPISGMNDIRKSDISD